MNLRVLAVTVVLLSASDVFGQNLHLSIVPATPAPAVQDATVSFRYAIENTGRVKLRGTMHVDLIEYSCSEPACDTSLPAITVRPSAAIAVRGQISFVAPLGRRSYTLLLHFDGGTPALSTQASRDFYVEKPDEQSDAFRSAVDVSDESFPPSFCDQTSWGWRFERNDSNLLQMEQPYNQCTHLPVNSFSILSDGTILSAPALALTFAGPHVSYNKRINLFYRGSDSRPRMRVWEGIPYDNDPVVMSGFMTSAPTAFASASGGVELFYRGANNTLVNQTLSAGGGSGGETIMPMAVVDSAPAAFTFRDGIDVVVYRGANKHLWLIVRNRRTNLSSVVNNAAPWGLPEDLGGVALRSSPGISEKSGDQILVIEYRGPDDRLWESTWDGQGWWSAPSDTNSFP